MEQQSTSTREIADNSSHASREIEDVKANIHTTSTASGKIKVEILEVDTAAKGIREISRKLNSQAENLTALTGKLKKVMNRYRN